MKTEAAPVIAASGEEAKTEETPAKAAEEKPKPTKRGSIFGSFVEKLKSPREEKKEHDFGAAPVKEAEPVPEASKPLEEAQVAAPATPVAAETTSTEPVAPKTEESKPVTGTPSREKDHFSFGKFFGNKERAKSPAPEPKAADAAPKIEDTPAPAATEPVQPVEPVAPVTETKPEPVEEKKEDSPKKEEKKRSSSFFGSLTRSLSKATTKKDVKQQEQPKETPATVPETSEEAPVVAETKTETPALDAPAEKTIGDVPAEAVSVGEPKSNPTVATTA